MGCDSADAAQRERHLSAVIQGAFPSDAACRSFLRDVLHIGLAALESASFPLRKTRPYRKTNKTPLRGMPRPSMFYRHWEQPQ